MVSTFRLYLTMPHRNMRFVEDKRAGALVQHRVRALFIG